MPVLAVFKDARKQPQPSNAGCAKPLPSARAGAGHTAHSWHAPSTLVPGAEGLAQLRMAPEEREHLVGIS